MYWFSITCLAGDCWASGVARHMQVLYVVSLGNILSKDTLCSPDRTTMRKKRLNSCLYQSTMASTNRNLYVHPVPKFVDSWTSSSVGRAAIEGASVTIGRDSSLITVVPYYDSDQSTLRTRARNTLVRRIHVGVDHHCAMPATEGNHRSHKQHIRVFPSSVKRVRIVHPEDCTAARHRAFGHLRERKRESGESA